MYFSRLPLFLAAATAAGPFFVSAVPEQTIDAACSSAITAALPAMTAIPTADERLLEFVEEQAQRTTITESCAVPAVTGPLASDYSSYVSAVYSWQSEFKSELNNFRAECTDYPALHNGHGSFSDDDDDDNDDVCHEITWLSPVPTATEKSKNAAPRETGLGLAAAAAAAAGIAIAGVI